jgi:hypothetical protein
LISSFLSDEFKKDLARRKKMGSLSSPEIFNDFFVNYSHENGKLTQKKERVSLYYYIEDGFIWYNETASKEGARRTLLLKYLEFS